MNARVNHPKSVAVIPTGGVFISDTDNHRVRKVTPDGMINTAAGTGEPGYEDGGLATMALPPRRSSIDRAHPDPDRSPGAPSDAGTRGT